MKELVYKNIMGQNPRKREVSIEEISDRTESKVAKKWISKYFIKERYCSKNGEDLRKWINMKKKQGCRKDCHILREVNTRTGESKVVSKMLGEFFVIWAGVAYKILYVNEIRIHMDGREKDKRGIRWMST
ncbi:MAG: hypothetical protein ABID83_01905 [Candidatus Omnitrophota bacterium]